jgi:hypothetical protein
MSRYLVRIDPKAAKFLETLKLADKKRIEGNSPSLNEPTASKSNKISQP